MTEKEFAKTPLEQRYDLLKKEGELIGKRYYTSYEVYLYTFSGFYAEVWKKTGLNMIYWIEPVNHIDILSEYVST